MWTLGHRRALQITWGPTWRESRAKSHLEASLGMEPWVWNPGKLWTLWGFQLNQYTLNVSPIGCPTAQRKNRLGPSRPKILFSTTVHRCFEHPCLMSQLDTWKRKASVYRIGNKWEINCSREREGMLEIEARNADCFRKRFLSIVILSWGRARSK